MSQAQAKGTKKLGMHAKQEDNSEPNDQVQRKETIGLEASLVILNLSDVQ